MLRNIVNPPSAGILIEATLWIDNHESPSSCFMILITKGITTNVNTNEVPNKKNALSKSDAEMIPSI